MIPSKRLITVLNYENNMSFYRVKLPSLKFYSVLWWSDHCLLFTRILDQAQVSDIPYEDVKDNMISITYTVLRVHQYGT